VGLVATLFRRHILWVLGAVAAGVVAWLVLRGRGHRKSSLGS
jgi:hypothetical protein